MRIFYDVDTQNDFMNANGALYVPGAEEIKPALKELTDYALRNNIPIIGSVDRHFGTEEYKERESELQRWGGPFPDHCMGGTEGELKIQETTYSIGGGRGADERETDRYDDWGRYIPRLLLPEMKDGADFFEMMKWIGRYKNAAFDTIKYKGDPSKILPIYFEKQSYDVFTNPAADHFFTQATKLPELKEAVLYGVATDYCVKAAALGMRERGIDVYAVEDAIKGVAEDTTEAAIKEMKEAGCEFVSLEQILEVKENAA